ncbi:Basic leucine zipper like [Melia azedarach]|uniref:Basic leucine zipper like n=1 Tax=Melia azedarach TaxID=155640 RepID=A0ACC1XJC5_MELAZ|nr:Basic leucine zipper like [Melia azedarach]
MKENMDDGEVELSDHVLFPNQDSSSNFQNSATGDSFLDEFLKNTRTCTHTHTCNPPGPDAAHTHTCYHTHTQVIASEEDNHSNRKEHSSLKPRKSSGNREAVRKYREKKKAHTAYLEEEVKKLRLINQQLVRKLQGQAILDAEVMRLRSLLVDFKAKIDHELGAFPFQKQCNGTTNLKEDDCGVQSNGGTIGVPCQSDLPCFHPQAGSSSHTGMDGTGKILASWEGNCEPTIIDCQADTRDIVSIVSAEGQTLDAVEALVSSSSQAELAE